MSAKQTRISLYNTLIKSKKPFAPLDADHVRMYVCGPTVYDYAHIGNARPAVVFDVLFRLLRHAYGEDHVSYVRNITDVDDKITLRARKEHPNLSLNEAIAEVTARTEKQYQSDMSALGCMEPTIQPRATEHISHMVAMISALIENGHAYAAEGHVLFDVSSHPTEEGENYGRLSRRDVDDMVAGARVEVAPFKRDPMDFVLWKPSSENEPGWDSPFGHGRPGWHIECSAMAKEYLGETFDIHGGGIDLSFPHHENELAQSCCANQTNQMAQVWMHNGFLNIEGEKMSKSLGNFFTVHDLLETEKFGDQKWDGSTLRLALLMTNYREPIDFSLARLKEAQSLMEKWLRIISDAQFEPDQLSGAEPETAMIDAVADDLNMSRAFAELHKLASAKTANASLALLGSLQFLGLVTPDVLAEYEASQAQNLAEINVAAVEKLIADRLTALAEKDWPRADALRDEAAGLGVTLKDGKDPSTGERTTAWEPLK